MTKVYFYLIFWRTGTEMSMTFLTKEEALADKEKHHLCEMSPILEGWE